MDEIQRNRLLSESEKGQKASYVYEMYLEEFVNSLEKELSDAFFSSAPDPEQLLELKRLSMALGAIKAKVIKDIEGGKIADKLLAEDKVH